MSVGIVILIGIISNVYVIPRTKCWTQRNVRTINIKNCR